jgi:hypothetical protein
MNERQTSEEMTVLADFAVTSVSPVMTGIILLNLNYVKLNPIQNDVMYILLDFSG